MVLGPACWGQVHYAPDPAEPLVWAKLKKIVNARFGLTHDQEEQRFYDQKYEAGQDPAKFVLAVETQRRELGISSNGLARLFVAGLPI